MADSLPVAARKAGLEHSWADQRWRLAALYAALTAIALYPVFAVTVPPLVDYPNHLARMHILAHWDSVPALQQNYVTDWTLHPNMAMELTVPLLAQIMPIYMAGKLFVAATMLMLLGGTIALRKTLFGRVGLWPVLTFVVLYNHALFWGFLNYLFAAGLALCAFSAWIALREHGWRARAVLFVLVAFLLYVCHLFGLLIYGVLVLTYELGRARDQSAAVTVRPRDWLVTAAQFAAPAILFFYWVSANASTEKALTDFGTLADRAAIFLTPVHFNMTAVDIATLAFLGLAWLAARSGGARIAPAMRLPLIALSAVALAMPVYLSGVWGTHIRLPVIIVCLLIAATQLDVVPPRRIAALGAVALALFTLRTAFIVEQWRDLDAKFGEFRAAAAVIAPAARLLTVLDNDDLPAGGPPLYAMPFWHMNALAVIERGAFVPTLFTGHTMIAAAPPVRHLDTPVGDPVSRELLALGAVAAASRVPLGYRLERYVRAYWIGWPGQYDYLLSIRFANRTPVHPEHIDPVAAGSFFDLGKVR